MPKKNAELNQWHGLNNVAVQGHAFLDTTTTTGGNVSQFRVKPGPQIWVDRFPHIEASVYTEYLKKKKGIIEVELKWNYDLIDGMESHARKRGQTVETAFSNNPAYLAKYRQYRENIGRLNQQLKVLVMAEKRAVN